VTFERRAPNGAAIETANVRSVIADNDRRLRAGVGGFQLYGGKKAGLE
jgi:hypothetical protein